MQMDGDTRSGAARIGDTMRPDEHRRPIAEAVRFSGADHGGPQVSSRTAISLRADAAVMPAR